MSEQITFGDGVCGRCRKAAPKGKVVCEACQKVADTFNAAIRLHVEELSLRAEQAEASLQAEREKHDEEAYNDMLATKEAAEASLLYNRLIQQEKTLRAFEHINACGKCSGHGEERMSDNPLIGHGNNYYGNTDPLSPVGETPQDKSEFVRVPPDTALAVRPHGTPVEAAIRITRTHADPPTATPEQGKDENCGKHVATINGTKPLYCEAVRGHGGACEVVVGEYVMSPTPALLQVVADNRREEEAWDRALAKVRAERDKLRTYAQQQPAPASLADVPRYRIGKHQPDSEFTAVYSYDPDEDWTLDFDAIRALVGTDIDLIKLADIEPLVQRLEDQARTISVLLSDAGVGAMPIVDGVRAVLARAEQAEALGKSLEKRRLDAEAHQKIVNGYLDPALAEKEAAEASLQQLREENATLQRQLDAERFAQKVAKDRR